MSVTTILDGPGTRSRRTKRQTWVVAGILAAIVIVAAVVAELPTPPGPSSGGKLGPYTLGTLNTTYVRLSFPHCSNVTAQWNVTPPEENETFTVWTPPPVTNSSCKGAPPAENTTCPAQGCPQYLGDQLVCIEWGQGGTCAFRSTQANYTFLNYIPYDSPGFPSLSFVASYT